MIASLLDPGVNVQCLLSAVEFVAAVVMFAGANAGKSSNTFTALHFTRTDHTSCQRKKNKHYQNLLRTFAADTGKIRVEIQIANYVRHTTAFLI